MDNETAREILSAYRSNGADARDASFLEALEQADRDPETKFWFRDQQAFDRQISATMREVHTPPDGKERLLTMLELQANEPARMPVWKRFWQVGLGLAAVLVLTLNIVTFVNDQDNSRGERYVASSENFSLSQLARDSMPLEFRGKTANSLVNWLADQGAPIPQSLPSAFQQAMTNGCKVYATENGGVISLLCFEVDGELLHMFVFDEKARALLDVVPRQWWREGDWNMMAFNEGGQLVALVSKASPDAIDRMLSG